MHCIGNCLQDITLQEAETIALSILRQVMEEKVKTFLKLEINVQFVRSACVHTLVFEHAG